MTRVAITGATGNVGRQALEALDDHDVTPMARNEPDDIDIVELDVADGERFHEVIEDHDVLLHLAANPSPEAEWEEVWEPNIQGAFNAYEAALANGLDRVVFASTNHVSHMYNAADPADPESLVEDPAIIRPDDPPRPDSYYGISKVAGEAFGSYYADRHGLEVINLRIGWLMSEDQLAEEAGADDPSRARFARAMWLSPRDCRDAIRSSIVEDVDESPITVNVVSRNAERYLSIAETQNTIGYRPRDDASEVL